MRIRSVLTLTPLVLALCTGRAVCQTYQATILTPAGTTDSFAFGAGGGQAVGTGQGASTGNNTHAFVWQGTAASAIDLNPIGTFTVATNTSPVPASGSFAYGAGGGQQVGLTILGLTDAATLWTGTPESAVFLNPDGVSSANAAATDGVRQVGTCRIVPDTHAFAWSGSAASALDIHPNSPDLTYTSSYATGISNGRASGLAVDDNGAGFYEAIFWSSLSPSGVVVLHAPDLLESRTNTLVAPIDISGVVQIYGEAYPDGLPWHATRWTYTPGTPATIVRADLHPAGYFKSFINAASATVQVGIAGLAPNSDGVSFERAMVWSGTAASAIDLHAALLQAAPGYENSVARGVDAQGNIYGYAYTVDPSSGQPTQPYIAVRWSPVVSGACCRGATCVASTSAGCTGAGVSFAGPGTVCGSSAVQPCCKADFNQNGSITVTDIFEFLSAWFAGNTGADFNGGGIAVSDIFAFLNAWFAGC